MLSKYFQLKTKTKKFDDDLLWSMGEIKGRKVLLYGAGEDFVELNKLYFFKDILNIVAIADKKFESDPVETFESIRAITPNQIKNEDYDVLLITSEDPRPILDFVFNDLCVENKDVRTVFNEEIKDERENLNYLFQYNFDKTLPKLVKKLKGKSIVLYGAGIFLELIKKYFNLSELNVIGIADRRFSSHGENEEFLGYKAISPDEIKSLKPDYVLVATKKYIDIIEDLYYNTLKGSKIKIKPLIKKDFWTLVKEIWG